MEYNTPKSISYENNPDPHGGCRAAVIVQRNRYLMHHVTNLNEKNIKNKHVNEKNRSSTCQKYSKIKIHQSKTSFKNFNIF